MDDKPGPERERIVCEQDPPTPSVVIRHTHDIVAPGRAATDTTPDHIGGLRGEDLSQLRRKLHGDLDNIILMAMQKDPARRYRSVEQFSEDIDRYLRGHPVIARKDTLAYRSGKLIKRNKPVFAALMLLAVALAAGTAGTCSGWLRARAERRIAQRERNAALTAKDDALAVTAYLQGMLSAANPFRRGRNATVLELLADAEQKINRDLSGKPSVEAGVRFALGHTYAGMWRWPDAARNLRVALQLYRDTGQHRTAETAKCLTLLGRAMTFARSAESVTLQQQAVAIRTELFGNADPRTAESKGNLGYALWLGVNPPRFEQAEPLYREAITVLHDAPNRYRPDEARFTFSLAAMLGAARRVAESEALFDAALVMFRNLPVREDRYMVECMREYAGLLTRTGDFARAEALLSQAMAVTPLGSASDSLHQGMQRLADALLAHHRFADAERVLLASLSRSCEDAAAEHPDRAEDLTTFARALDPARSHDPAGRPIQPARELLATLTPDVPAELLQRVRGARASLQQSAQDQTP